MWQNLRYNLFFEIYIEPGVWNIPLTNLAFHIVLGCFVWIGAISWQLGVLIVLYPLNWRLVYATKKARKVLEAQRTAYQQAYNQQEIEAGRLLAPDGKEYL